MTSQQADVAAFLREFKQLVSVQRRPYLIFRAVNNETILQLGFTENNVKDEILDLSVADYCQGPSPDRDRPGDVWVFGRQIDNHEIYIKLKIAQPGATKIAKCISFHKANYPLNYPLR